MTILPCYPVVRGTGKKGSITEQHTGMTSRFLSCRILSAAGVVGPLAPSAMICGTKNKIASNFHFYNFFDFQKDK